MYILPFSDPFIVFDICYTNSIFVNQLSLVQTCHCCGINGPHILHIGGAISVDKIEKNLLNNDICSAKPFPEGAVWCIENYYWESPPFWCHRKKVKHQIDGYQEDLYLNIVMYN